MIDGPGLGCERCAELALAARTPQKYDHNPRNAKCTLPPLERGRPHGSVPLAHFGRIAVVHVEEVDHGGRHRPFAGIVEAHRDHSAEHLDRSAIPVFDDIVLRGEPCIDELTEVLANHFPSIPFRNSKAALGILCEAVESLAKCFVINLLPKMPRAIREVQVS